MTSRWAGKGLDARRRDEAVFKRHSEERQRRRQAFSGPAKPAQNRLICVVAATRRVIETQLSPLLLASEPTLCRREVMAFC